MRIVSIDTQTAHIWGNMTAVAQARGRTIPVSDGLIAATALRHGMVVVTRNVDDFSESGSTVLNPWEGAG